MKTREELKNMVELMIVPMIFGGAEIPWEVVEDLPLFADVVKERIEQDKNLQLKMAEGGMPTDISVGWTAFPGALMPTVRVKYKVQPLYREVDGTTFMETAKAWDEQRKVFFSFGIDCVDLDFQKIANSFAFQSIELTPVEIVQHHGHILVRCIRDMFGKEAEAKKKFYNNLYQGVLWGKNGLINQFKSEE